jgi:hypothetical protein
VDRKLEGGAVVAGPQVRADAARTQAAAISVGDAVADADALGRAPVDGLVESAAGVEHGAAGGLVGDAEGDRDVVVAQAAELAHDERAALALGQAAQVVDELGEADAVLGVDLGSGHGRLVELGEFRVRAAAADDVDRLVVGDAVQPRAQRAARLAARQAAQRVLEGVLGRVLGVLVVEEDRSAVAQERAVVALVERGEGGIAAGGGAAGEGLVAEARQDAAPQRRGLQGGGRGHSGTPIGSSERICEPA